MWHWKIYFEQHPSPNFTLCKNKKNIKKNGMQFSAKSDFYLALWFAGVVYSIWTEKYLFYFPDAIIMS